MRKMLLAAVLLGGAVGLSGCWDHRWGHDHPGHPSDHHRGGYGYY